MAPKGRNIDIDELFKSKLEDYPVTPGDAVRSKLMKKVSAREFLRFNPGRLNIWYVAASVITVTVALSIVFRDNREVGKNERIVAEDTVVVNVNTQQILPDSLVVNTEINDANPGFKRTEGGGTRAVFERANDGAAEQRVPQEIIKRQTEPVRFTFEVSGLDDKNRAISSPVGSFTVSELAGCAPFRVTLTNTSQYSRVKWISSDGKMSSESAQEWVFETPGSYKILFTVTDTNGREGHSSTVITVNKPPVATFDLSAGRNAGGDRELVTYNYSEDAISSFWDFGDGTSSNHREPDHTYKSSGKYRVTLRVTNESGCIDTVSHIFEVRNTFKIEFPNAFIPNQDGPTGGYYSSRSDDAAQVFHPECEGVVDYHLIIYNRTGMVVFESREINIGWDGYYKGKLSEPGVYVFRARGRFSNGEQFSKSGDLTLLRNKME